MSVSVRRSIPGTQPTVEMPVRRWVMPTSGSRRAASEHVVEVHQRLAHAHEHEVVDRLDAAEVQDLVEDLGRGQVAAELHLPGGAERARERAAGLRGDADRAAAVAVAHQDGLDGAAVVGVEERLDGAVGGVRLADELERGERDLGGQRRAQRGRQVGHLVVAVCAGRRPAPDLPRAERGLARLGEGPLEQLEIHATYRGRPPDAPRQIPRPCRRRLTARLGDDHRRRPRDRRRHRHHRSRPRRRRLQVRQGRRPPGQDRRPDPRRLPAQQARRRGLDGQGPAGAADRASRSCAAASGCTRSAGSTTTRPG